MVFSSVVFLFVFLPAVLLVYFICPKKARNLVLLIASLIFYAWGEPVYIFLMLASTVVAYICGRGIGAALDEGSKKEARVWLIMALVIHLGALMVFKYTDFFLRNINNIFDTHIKEPHLPLPVGISFYTFQILSYIVDVYWGKVAVQKSFVKLATYVALFPQLIAGPIVRYQTVEEEMTNRRETLDEFALGTRRFVAGLGKKVLIANTAGQIYTSVHALQHSQQSVAMLWLASIAYTIQIYYDFSGYSDMAIGLGRMFGFHFLENFNYPYVSRSITEFWRRWHMSLSSWFRDYVYIPLGGNRKGPLKQYRNIFIVWFLTGFWHGAEWTFIVWGLYFCLILIIEKLGLLKALGRAPSAVCHIYTMFLVVISWTIFAADNISGAMNDLGGMFGLKGLSFWNDRTTTYLVSNLVLLVIAAVGSTHLPKKMFDRYIDRPGIVRSTAGVVLVLALFLLSIAYLVSASFNPFLYFRF